MLWISTWLGCLWLYVVSTPHLAYDCIIFRTAIFIFWITRSIVWIIFWVWLYSMQWLDAPDHDDVGVYVIIHHSCYQIIMSIISNKLPLRNWLGVYVHFFSVFVAFIWLLYVFCNLITSVTFFPNDHQDKWRNLGIASIPQAPKEDDLVLTITCGSLPTTQNADNALALVPVNGATATNTPRTSQDGGIIINRRFVPFLSFLD